MKELNSVQKEELLNDLYEILDEYNEALMDLDDDYLENQDEEGTDDAELRYGIKKEKEVNRVYAKIIAKFTE